LASNSVDILQNYHYKECWKLICRTRTRDCRTRTWIRV